MGDKPNEEEFLAEEIIVQMNPLPEELPEPSNGMSSRGGIGDHVTIEVIKGDE